MEFSGLDLQNLPAATKESRDENQLTEWDEVLSDGEIEAKPGLRSKNVPHQYIWVNYNNRTLEIMVRLLEIIPKWPNYSG